MSPGRPNKRKNGECTVCRRSRRLTDDEVQLMRPHRVPHSASPKDWCPGTGSPPVPVSAKWLAAKSWARTRLDVIARDGGRCKKCCAADDLEAHHKSERAAGGSDEPDNLITLCSACHIEWTICESAAVPFDTWIKLLPTRVLVGVLAIEWPENMSAAEWKEHIHNAFAMQRFEQYPEGWKPTPRAKRAPR